MNPEMVIVALVSKDRWLGKACPNCVRPFRIGDEVFESSDQMVAIHVTCVVALALVAGLRPRSSSDTTERYHDLREQLIERLAEAHGS